MSTSQRAHKPVPGILASITAAAAKAGVKKPELDERGIPKKLGEQFRRSAVDTSSGFDKEAGTVTMAFSSETPVDRWYGVEVLSHEKGAIRTGRLKGGVSLLFNHDYDKQLGRSVSWQLRDDKTGEITARFGPSPLAQEKMADVEAGILVDVSFGYIVHEWEITEDKNGVRTYLAVDWEPLEVSLVTVPADPTVGVGRGAEPVEVKVRSFRSFDSASETVPPVPDATRTADPDEDDDDEDDDPEPDPEDDRSAQPVLDPPIPATQRTTIMAEETVDLAAQNETRKAGLRALHTAYPEAFTARALEAAIALDVPLADAKRSIAERIITDAEKSDVPTVGEDTFGRMSAKEIRNYSIAAAYRAAVNKTNPGTFRGKEEGGFEREVSESLLKEAEDNGVRTLGAGIVIPSVTNKRLWQAQLERAISSGGNAGTASNFTVVNPDPIELLRTQTGCLALGARMLPGLHGAMQMTRQNAAASSSWLAELAGITESDPGFDFFTMKPNRLSIANAYTRDFLAQSDFAIESILSDDRREVLGISLDTAGIAGSGVAPVPKGMLNYTGLGALLAGSARNASTGAVTAGAGGAPLTYVDITHMESGLGTGNAGQLGTPAWLTTYGIRGALLSTPKTPGTASEFIWPDSPLNSLGLQAGPRGYQAKCITNPALTGFTANSVAGCHAMILGIWNQMLIGDWGLSEVIVDPYTGAANATINITEHAFYDINFRHIAAFIACTSAVPS
jgi:HK97 family phage prohead protease/HK97 family phage major capsid protein